MQPIQTLAELRRLLGEPATTTAKKIHRRLNDAACRFIARSPFVVLATADASGQPTVSPKGDAPGFVKVVDAETLHLPERQSNRLLTSMQNVLSNPRIGLLFLLPGTSETLRVHGQCRLLTDPDLCSGLVARGRPALLVWEVQVVNCYFHCGKALVRSELWRSTTWGEPFEVSLGREINAELDLSDEECTRFASEFDRAIASAPIG